MVKVLCAAVAAALAASAAHAQLKVGLTLSLTGPAASLGIPEKNTVDLMPKKIGGLDVTYVVLDDASDTTKAVTNTKKLITEDKVDVIVGSTTTPNAMAMIDVIRTDSLSRLRLCEGEDCENVLIDLSKNQSRKFCDTACANRAHAAAYRARLKESTP